MAENKCAARLEPSSRDMSELKNRFKPGYDWETICSTMLEHLMCGVAIYELCPDRVRSLYFNKKYYEMVGYTKEQYEQYADSVTSSLYGDSAEMIFEKARRSVKTEKHSMPNAKADAMTAVIYGCLSRRSWLIL